MRYILILLLLVSYNCQAQFRIIESRLDVGCRHDSLFNYVYNTLIVDVEDIPFEQLTIKSDSADVVKNYYGRFLVRVKPNQDSVHLKIYDQGVLVDTLTKFVARTILLPGVRLCGGRLSCLTLDHPNPHELSCIKIFAPFSGRLNDSIKYTVLSFVADVTIKGKVYTEYITGDSFTESFNNMYRKSFKRDRIVLRSVVVKDGAGNIFVIPETIFPNSLSYE